MLQLKDKEKSANTINKEILLTFLKTNNNKANQTATLIDGVLTGSQAKSVNQGVVDLRLSDCNLIYYTRKSSLPRSHIHKEIFVLSVKSTLPETFWENLRETNMHLCKYFLLRQKDYVSNTKMR